MSSTDLFAVDAVGSVRGSSRGASHLANGEDRDSPVTQWLMNEAKSKLQEAVNKLNLDSQKLNGKHLA